MSEIPDDVRQFVFEHIDSVEQLEVLLLMRLEPARWFTAETVSRELRFNPASVANRLANLLILGLLEESPSSPGSYRYHPRTSEMAAMVARLEELYQVKRHRVFELIFSSLKKARQFADAFVVGKPSNTNGDSDG